MDITSYIDKFYEVFKSKTKHQDLLDPWKVTDNLEAIVLQELSELNKDDFNIQGDIAVHKSAIIEDFVIMKGCIIINEGCIIKSGTYLRGPVFLGENVSVGPNCEIKQTVILDNTRVAHLNYIGNSILGKDVNIEGGAILANHFNERVNKEVAVFADNKKIMTGSLKFGSLIGDNSRIGANSVLNPGTILIPGTVVGRLVHVDQLKDYDTY